MTIVLRAIIYSHHSFRCYKYAVKNGFLFWIKKQRKTKIYNGSKADSANLIGNPHSTLQIILKQAHLMEKILEKMEKLFKKSEIANV